MAIYWLMNLVSYSAQVAAIVAAGGLLLYLLRIRIPKIRLVCLQALIALSIILPAVQPWHRSSDSTGVRISTGPAIPRDASQKPASPPFPIEGFILSLFLTGVAVRFGLLGVGFLRLQRYRRNSRFVPGAFQELQRRMGAFADIQISTEVTGPVTFGLSRPVILLPEDCLQNDSIACHELVHVRRRDWLCTVLEECALSVFWFHPAMWWLVSQIQLAREETVDREVVSVLNSREQYLESLLALAAARAGFDLAPASPFLRKRHLRKRVASLLKEVSMSKLRLSSSLAAFAMALALAGWISVKSFPLQAAPQKKGDGAGVTVEQGSVVVLHRAPVNYPPEALAKRIQGTVLVEVSLSDSGAVNDAFVLSGPDELRAAALKSVLQWHFDTHSAMKTQVSVNFHIPEGTNVGVARQASPVPEVDDGAVLGHIDFSLPEALRKKIQGNLNVHLGDHLTPASVTELSSNLKSIDEHLQVRIMRTPGEPGSTLMIELNDSPQAQPEAPSKIRVGGNVQSANLIEKVTPVYPAEAKAAKIQGVVRFTATIAKDGTVESLELVSGHPLLVPVARDAVMQWRYRPTLLNGNPVEVVTVIDINFTLSE